MTPEHLYFHVPFCLRRCGYCDFAVTVDRQPPVTAWLEAVRLELRRWIEREGWSAPLDPRTVYIGGGTPSLLGTTGMSEFRRTLEDLVRFDGRLTEWTAEANPESFDAELAHEWRQAGVGRVSLGVQTFSEAALRWMGRLHGARGACDAVAAARAGGLENVSIDLMFGLPDHLQRDWDADLERALGLEPDHISLYGLTAEAGTPLGRRVAAGQERLPDEEGYESEYLLAAERAGAAGFEHYEVSNFARPGRRGMHNEGYWSGAAYLGVGPAAHTYLPPVRSWNLRDWAAYRKALRAGTSTIAETETVADPDVRLERIWLALRTAEGLPAETARRLPQERLEEWQQKGWVRPEAPDRRVRLTAAGWLILDRLAVEVDELLDREHRTREGARANSARKQQGAFA